MHSTARTTLIMTNTIDEILYIGMQNRAEIKVMFLTEYDEKNSSARTSG